MSFPLLLAGLQPQAEARLEAGGGQDAGRSLSEAPASPPWNLQALHTPLRSGNQKLFLLTIYAPMIYTAPCIMFWLCTHPKHYAQGCINHRCIGGFMHKSPRGRFQGPY